MEQGNFGDVARDGLKLMEDQPSSPYSTGIALLLAKFYFEKEEMDKAIEQLNWVVLNAPEDALKLIARLRMAQMYQGKEDLDQALTALDLAKALTVSTAEQANLDYAFGELYLAKQDLVKASGYFKSVVDNNAASANLVTLARMQLDDITQ